MYLVAPYTGAWIEMQVRLEINVYDAVAPYTGAWIEIRSFISFAPKPESLPTRERGLK